jgi:hypothetical protein
MINSPSEGIQRYHKRGSVNRVMAARGSRNLYQEGYNYLLNKKKKIVVRFPSAENALSLWLFSTLHCLMNAST